MTDLTEGERKLAKAVYKTEYEELDEMQKNQFYRHLEGLPDALHAGLDGDVITKEQLDEGMEEAFATMVEDEDIPKEWKDGAVVFAKALKKKFGLKDE